MRRKWIAALCVASLSMAMMTGCGNGSTQETAKETQTETQTQAETQSETQTETASETEKATETESETAKAEKAAETEAKEGNFPSKKELPALSTKAYFIDVPPKSMPIAYSIIYYIK